MEAFMAAKSYTLEAEFINVMRNWRRACDERGFSRDERSSYNLAFRKYILNELIPWHLSYLEANR